MSQEPKITSQNIADIINGIQITPEQAQQNRRLNADLLQQPAVEGWESGFDAIWVRGQHDTTPYHLCKDFIRSQITKAFERGRYQKLKDMGLEDEITKAKEEERRVVVGEVQNLLKEEKWGYHTMGDDTRKAFDLEELNKMCLASNNNTIDSIQSRLSSLLPTGDNKQI